MKFKNILVLSLSSLLLVSCGGSTNNNNNDDNKNQDQTITIQDSFFNNLKQGYILESKVSETINNETKYFIQKQEHKNTAYSSFVYGYADTLDTATTNTLSQKETYYAVKEGNNTYVANGRLGVNNKVNLSKIKYGNDSEYAGFEKYGFINFFTYFSSTTFDVMFEKINNVSNTYSLKDTFKTNSIGTSIATQLYGQPGLVLDSFVLEFNKDGISSIEANLTYDSSKNSYDYTYETKILSSGNINFEEAYTPYAKTQDTKFNAFYSDINNKNFTVYVQNYENSNETTTISLEYDNDKFIYSYLDEDGEETTINAIKKDNTYYQVLVETDEDNNKTYKYGNPLEESLVNGIIPKFDISGDVFKFDEESHTYKIKENIVDTMDSIVGFEVSAEVINDLEMQLYVYDGGSNQYAITNTYGNNSTYITLSSCGETTIPFNSTNIIEASTWKESLFASSNDFNILKTLLDNDLAILPVPTSMDQEGKWSIVGNITDNSSSTMKLIYDIAGDYDEDTLLDYYFILMDYEWELDEDNECFYKLLENNILKAEVLLTEDTPTKFYIQFSYVTE